MFEFIPFPKPKFQDLAYPASNRDYQATAIRELVEKRLGDFGCRSSGNDGIIWGVLRPSTRTITHVQTHILQVKINYALQCPLG
jgi:hypothetical protein